MVKNLPANAGDVSDTDLIPGLGRYPGEGNGNQLQYSCLENSKDRGAWWAVVHRGRKELEMSEQLTHTAPKVILKIGLYLLTQHLLTIF